MAPAYPKTEVLSTVFPTQTRLGRVHPKISRRLLAAGWLLRHASLQSAASVCQVNQGLPTGTCYIQTSTRGKRDLPVGNLALALHVSLGVPEPVDACSGEGKSWGCRWESGEGAEGHACLLKDRLLRISFFVPLHLVALFVSSLFSFVLSSQGWFSEDSKKYT